MIILFDLFNGEQSPSEDFKAWIPSWWYRSETIPVQMGKLLCGDEWLFAGFCLTKKSIENLITEFRSTGIETLFRADGQFIFVLYSKSENNVEIYRDRTGILPLFYSRSNKGLLISTDIRNSKDMAQINTPSVESQTLLKQWPLYRINIFPDTPLNNVKSISPKYSLSIKNKQINQTVHEMAWPAGRHYKSLDSAACDLGEILSSAVEKRVKNRKSIGAWLSGGNDSSLLVALTRKHHSGVIKTLFVTFEDYHRNYKKYALQVADQFCTEHLEIELSTKDYVNLWAETIEILQSPLDHPGVIGQTIGFRTLSGLVDTVLTGEGADTVFGGPYWAPMLALSYIGGIMPLKIRSLILTLFKDISERNYVSKLFTKSIRALGTPLSKYLHSEQSFGVKEDIDRVFGYGTWENAINSRKSFTGDDLMKGLFSFHILYWMPLKVATEMLLGLNCGVLSLYPFLDYELMQASLRLPINLRYHYSAKKAVLKRYALSYFGREFIYKPKEGFGVPLGKWFSKPELVQFLSIPLEARSLQRGWWNEKELRQIIELHRDGKGTDESAESIPWITTNLELWARICLEGDSPDLYKI
jgi:asparagine synthase (glutamine-hydrolysing)